MRLAGAGSRKYPVTTALAGPPEAVDMRRDHRAAGAEFLHEMRGAVSHRVRPRIIPRVDVVRIVVRIDPDSGRRAADISPALRGDVGDMGLLEARARRLRPRDLRQQQK